jgi:hypothetical protein
MRRRAILALLGASVLGPRLAGAQARRWVPENTGEDLTPVYNITRQPGEPQVRVRATFFQQRKYVELKSPGTVSVNGMQLSGGEDESGAYSYTGRISETRDIAFRLRRSEGGEFEHAFQLLPVIAEPEAVSFPHGSPIRFRIGEPSLRKSETVVLRAFVGERSVEALGKTVDGSSFSFAPFDPLRVGKYSGIVYRSVQIPLRDISSALRAGWGGVSYGVHVQFEIG